MLEVNLNFPSRIRVVKTVGYPRRHPKNNRFAVRGPDCGCGECSRRYDQSGMYESNDSGDGRFEGKAIKVIVGETGRKERFEFFYGGLITPDGIGHGHVVCNDGETINYWRKPNHEGGQTIIDDKWSTERLSGHMF